MHFDNFNEIYSVHNDNLVDVDVDLDDEDMDLGEIEDDPHDLYDVDQNEEEASYYFFRTFEKRVLRDIFVFNCYITKEIFKI